MNEITYHCGDADVLVAYLYGEANPGERRAVATHLNQCASCEAEVAALTATREQLAAWRPPDTSLGFHVDGLGAVAPVARAWWHNPLPAWMQVAAAGLVFAAGLAVGAARQGGTGVPVASVATAPPAVVRSTSAPAPAPASSASAGSGVASPVATQVELARVEAGLRAEIAAMRAQASTVPAARRDDEAVMRQVRVLLQESEARQQRELALRTAQVIRDFEIQRRLDMVTVRQTIGQVEGATGAELRRQQDMWTALATRVGQSGPAR